MSSKDTKCHLVNCPYMYGDRMDCMLVPESCDTYKLLIKEEEEKKRAKEPIITREQLRWLLDKARKQCCPDCMIWTKKCPETCQIKQVEILIGDHPA